MAVAVLTVGLTRLLRQPGIAQHFRCDGPRPRSGGLRYQVRQRGLGTLLDV